MSGGRAQQEGHRARGLPEEAARNEEACDSQAAEEGREGLSSHQGPDHRPLLVSSWEGYQKAPKSSNTDLMMGLIL